MPIRTPILAAAVLLCAAPALCAQAPPAPQPRFTVVLDAAHGGDDPGAHITVSTSAPELEKADTLALSVRLRSLLNARGIPVVTTRESDTAVPLDRRAEIANRAAAQACLSFHASQTGSGIHLYVSSLAPTAPARFVPWKTAQSAYVARSVALAGVLNSALTHAGFTVSLGRTSLPAVDSMTCPAVAIELAPESADPKSASPADDAYQAAVAQALAAALVEWRSEDPAAVIPRYQTVLFIILLAASTIMSVVLWQLRDRAHQRMLAGEQSSPTQAPAVAPSQAATLLVAHDADNSLLAQTESLPLPDDPGSRARLILGKLLDLYATPGSPHPVPGGASSIAQVFLLPIPNQPAPSTKTQERGAPENHDSGQLAVVNLTLAFANNHPSGLEAEDLTIESIVATLHANFPTVTQVRFLVDGQTRPTLAGHADLTRTYLTTDSVPTAGIHP